jgi:hypothetical protein
MAQIAGIKVERASNGFPKYVTIDLRKHTEFIPLLEEKGVEMDEPIKWTAKMKCALKETEFKKGNINNFWDE